MIDMTKVEVEFLPLPTTNINFQFLIRIGKPFDFVLDQNPIEVTGVELIAHGNIDELIKEKVRQRLEKCIACSGLVHNPNIQVNLVEMELVRK